MEAEIRVSVALYTASLYSPRSERSSKKVFRKGAGMRTRVHADWHKKAALELKAGWKGHAQRRRTKVERGDAL
eukprot:6131576-Pleurochrysis_carterae.AAC.3